MAKRRGNITIHKNRNGEVIDIKSLENQEKLKNAVFKIIDKFIEEQEKISI